MDANPIVMFECFFVAVNAMCVKERLTLFKVRNKTKRHSYNSEISPKISTFSP